MSKSISNKEQSSGNPILLPSFKCFKAMNLITNTNQLNPTNLNTPNQPLYSDGNSFIQTLPSFNETFIYPFMQTSNMPICAYSAPTITNFSYYAFSPI